MVFTQRQSAETWWGQAGFIKMITKPNFAAELLPEVSETVTDEADMEKAERRQTNSLVEGHTVYHPMTWEPSICQPRIEYNDTCYPDRDEWYLVGGNTDAKRPRLKAMSDASRVVCLGH